MNQTLYERIGGKNLVEKASHILYVNILRDDRLKDFFDDIDIEKQKRKMSAFLTYTFGGPSLYLGKDMRRAHKHAVEHGGLSDEHVDAMKDCMSATLRELEKDNDLISEVLNVIENHRKDVLNK